MIKRLLTCLVCVGAISFTPLSVHAEDIIVSHTHFYVGTGSYFTALTGSYNEGTHTVAIMENCKCSCGAISSVEVRREERPHSLSFTSVSNNHASPGIHHFRGTCACGFSTTVMLDCPGGNNHVAP